MVPASLLATLFLALAVAGSPAIVVERSPVTLSISKRFNLNSDYSIAQQDRLRAQALIAKAKGLLGEIIDIVSGIVVDIVDDGVVSSKISNHATSYIASVDVGSPPTAYNLIVDTGSSNIWIGAGTSYTPTVTSTRTAQSVNVTYGSGSFAGTEYIDLVTIGPGLVIPHQSIGVASKSTGFDGVDGIIGVGPTDLTANTLSPDTNAIIPTVTDNLFKEGAIAAHEIGVSFEPITDSSGIQLNGQITWGGTDKSKYTGEITYTPITSTEPASTFWGIDQSITYGSTTILSSTAGIVDTGTTLVLIADDAFVRYTGATGGVLDSNTGLLKITSDQYSNLQSLVFHIQGVSFELTANAQIWPRILNTAIGGTSDSIYLIVSNTGSPSGSGLDFLNGQAFLERFYSVYDTGNQRVGLATTSFTTATTN